MGKKSGGREGNKVYIGELLRPGTYFEGKNGHFYPQRHQAERLSNQLPTTWRAALESLAL